MRIDLEEGRTKKILTEEYGLGKSTNSIWQKQRREECKTKPRLKEQLGMYEENKRLRRKLAEKEKENGFLKKAAAFFAKEIE